MTRRRALAVLGCGAAGILGVGLYTWRVEPHWVEVVERDMPLAGLPTAMRGVRIAQISDVHVGDVVDSSFLIDALQRVNDLRPDMVVCTGDWMTCWRHERIDRVIRVMASLDQPRLGCIGIMGNHDYGRGAQTVAVADHLSDKLAAAGWRILRNQQIDVGGLQIIGLDDFWSPCYDPSPVLQLRDPDRPTLVLCHNPDVCDEPVWHDFRGRGQGQDVRGSFRGWILAGHTHGGQCRIPFGPAPLLPVRNKRYVSGHIDLADGRHLYINRGLGYLRRVRFNARPEITLFTLQSA